MRDSTSADIPQPGSYAGEWREFRRRRRIALGVFFLGPPTVILLSAAGDSFAMPSRPFLALMVAVSITFLITMMRFGGWRCPRCGKPFLAGLWFLPIRRCVFCKLPIWAESGTGPELTFGRGRHESGGSPRTG